MGIGLFACAAGFLVTPKAGEEFMSPLFIYGGLAFMAIGPVYMIYQLLPMNPQVDVYTHGVRFIVKRKELFIPWDKMEDVRIHTVYDTRFSNYRLVSFDYLTHKELWFNSKIEGDPLGVIDLFEENLPNAKVGVIDLGA